MSFLICLEAEKVCFLSRSVPLSTVSRRGGDAVSIGAKGSVGCPSKVITTTDVALTALVCLDFHSFHRAAPDVFDFATSWLNLPQIPSIKNFRPINEPGFGKSQLLLSSY